MAARHLRPQAPMGRTPGAQPVPRNTTRMEAKARVSRSLRSEALRGAGRARAAAGGPEPGSRDATDGGKPTGLKGTRRELATPAPRPNFSGAQKRRPGGDL